MDSCCHAFKAQFPLHKQMHHQPLPSHLSFPSFPLVPLFPFTFKSSLFLFSLSVYGSLKVTWTTTSHSLFNQDAFLSLSFNNILISSLLAYFYDVQPAVNLSECHVW